MAHATYHRTVLRIGNPAHGIQCIIEKMRIDLRLQHFILRPLYQHFMLQFFLRHDLHTVKHFIKFRTQRSQLLGPSYGLHPKLSFSVLDPCDSAAHLFYRLCHPLRHKQYDHHNCKDHGSHYNKKCSDQCLLRCSEKRLGNKHKCLQIIILLRHLDQIISIILLFQFTGFIMTLYNLCQLLLDSALTLRSLSGHCDHPVI